jgi:hypothetical protein
MLVAIDASTPAETVMTHLPRRLVVDADRVVAPSAVAAVR